jgi:epoxide hydrolase A/B
VALPCPAAELVDSLDPLGQTLKELSDWLVCTEVELADEIEQNPAGIRTSKIPTNGLRLHAALQGEGDLVILIHGFPQCWYVWRHQIPLLAEAGYQVCAPDQRGYGLSDCPPGVNDYDILKVTADIVGLADTLGAEKFTVVGQDWGCITAWHVALLYPHRVHGVLGFSAPYVPSVLRNWVEPSQYRDSFWYTRYFMQPGVAEAELDENLDRYLMWMWHASTAGSETNVLDIISGGPKDRKLLDGLGATPTSVRGHSQQDLDYCLKLYHASGMRGSLNYYRNMARMRDITPWLEEARILVPAMFACGDSEPAAYRNKDFDSSLTKAPFDAQDDYFVNLLGKVVIPDAGHWPMLEQPDFVNRLVLDFLAKVNPVAR